MAVSVAARSAVTALAIVAFIRLAAAEPEPLRPVVSRHGWQIDLSGYGQIDWVPWSQRALDELDPSTSKPLNDERFLIRRGRLRVDAHRDAVWSALELDGNTIDGAVARIIAAQVGWKYRDVIALTAGLFKVPFGAEVPAPERDKPFLEPPTVTRALFAGNYDAGMMASGSYGLARWAVALTNGAPAGDAQWKGVDPKGSYDLVGRIGADIAGPFRSRFVVGVSALIGSGLSPGKPPIKPQVQWVDENKDGIVQSTELVSLGGSPGSPSQAFDHNALGADLAVHWCLCALGTGTAFAEVALGTNLDRGVIYADPVALGGRDLRELGVAIGVVQEVTRYAQVGVRYDRYDADRDAVEQEGVALVNIHKRFSTLAIMAAARWNDARFVVQYDRERNPFGRDDSGAPTTRAADRLTLRMQVGF